MNQALYSFDIVDIVLRSDFLEKDGGDTVQFLQYKEAAEKIAPNVSFALVPNLGRQTSLRPQSVVVIANVDRFFDFVDVVNYSIKGGHRVIACPIHHSLDHVRQMRVSERDWSIRGLAARLPEQAREYLAYLSRVLHSSAAGTDGAWVDKLGACWRATTCLPSTNRRVGAALGAADEVVSLSENEELCITEDFGTRGLSFRRIPNGVPSPVLGEPLTPWNDRSKTLLCVGRIEPRKRQLELALACEERGIDICFIGAANRNASRYCVAFGETVARSSTLSWSGALPREEVLRHMLKSRVIVNASWVEVQSLVDIEAASCGAFVCANDGGSSGEILSGSVRVVPGHDLDRMLDCAVELASGESGPSPLKYRWTWCDATRALLQLVAGVEESRAKEVN